MTPPPEFAEFYRAEYLRVLLFLRKQGASWEDGWDATQSAFLDALRHWDGIEHRRSWVRTVATRAYMKAQMRVAEDNARALRSEWAAPSWLDTAIMPDEENRVIEAIASLPPRQRQVMAWHYDGYTNQEIAQILSISADDVASNLYQARRRLKEWVDRQGRLSAAARTGGAR